MHELVPIVIEKVTKSFEILRLTAKEFFIVQHFHTDYDLKFEYKAK